MNKEGNVLGSCAKLYDSREGFEQFVKMTEGFKAKHGMNSVLFDSMERAGREKLDSGLSGKTALN